MAEGNRGGYSADAVVANTKGQAFPDGPQISLENFDDGSGCQEGIQTFNGIAADNQWDVQESYRRNLSKSSAAHEPVGNRGKGDTGSPDLSSKV